MSVYDVIVAGGGNAGLCAALSARDEGASVLLLERSPRWRRGGNSRHTRDIRYAHAVADPWAPMPYAPAEFLADLHSITDEIPRPDLAELLVHESQTLPEWMEAHGVRWQAAMHGTLHLHTNRFFLGGGKAMMNSYYETAESCGVEIRYESSAVELVLEHEGGSVHAVQVQGPEGTQRASTRAVVVASGGLEGNHAWLAGGWGAGAANFIVRGTPDNDGTLLLGVLDLGAVPVGSDLFHCIDRKSVV